MKRYIGVLCIVTCAALHITAAQAEENPKLTCDRGGQVGKYGGTDWIVYGCSDGKTLAFVATQGNPASPFYFMLTPKDGNYQLYGEGNGDKKLTDAAYAELKSLTPAQIDALLSSRGPSTGH